MNDFQIPVRLSSSRVLRLAGRSAILIWMLSGLQTSVAFGQAEWGKSHHGSHFDEGPRSKPWIMDGIGKTSFPISSKHPDVQKWFDQGHTLLHSFWYFEAERCFRWCVKLDPDCAMAYWGLARCSIGDDARASRFFKQAKKLEMHCTQRERDYLELWNAKYQIEKSKEDERAKAIDEYVKLFDNLLINYPDDIEARALYWLELSEVFSERGKENHYRYAMDRVLQEVLAKDPDHVGALHYRVHNWDGEEGHYALDTCLHLSQVAPNSGHLQHMPGHVFSSIGLWNEAAIAMDSATRVEKEYMRRRLVLPEDNWDYLHNLDYLCYIQEQLGMYEAALIGATQMQLAPPDQELSKILSFGNLSMARLLIKFEKWDEILKGKHDLASHGFLDGATIAYARAHALIGLGRLDDAELEIKKFESKIGILKFPQLVSNLFEQFFGNATTSSGDEKQEQDLLGDFIKIRRLELRGKLALARGDTETGIRLLEKAAELQSTSWSNDPPRDPMVLYTALGEAYLDLDRNEEAVKAFEKSLEKVVNDGFALSGLVVAHHRLGQQELASHAMARLQAVWKNADRPNRWLQRAEATKIRPGRIEDPLYDERDYHDLILSKKGHSLWAPPSAPELLAVDANGSPVSLEDYRGRNVILIFYLGDQCLHCMEQIQAASRRSEEFRSLGTEILAVSKDDIERLKEYHSRELGVNLLSDPDFENARRFHSYDELEEIELHSTLLIDRDGRVHWSRHGGEPFVDFDFLKQEVVRINARSSPHALSDGR